MLIVREQFINIKTRLIVSCGAEALQASKKYGLIETGDISKDIAKAWELLQQSGDYEVKQQTQEI